MCEVWVGSEDGRSTDGVRSLNTLNDVGYGTRLLMRPDNETITWARQTRGGFSASASVRPDRDRHKS